jgi:hypothetical protein
MSLLDRVWLWVREQLPFLAVLLVLAAAFVYLLVEPGRWRRGSAIIAASVLLAGVLRAALPSGRAGLLAVRGRIVDSVTYLVLGGLLLAVDIRLAR